MRVGLTFALLAAGSIDVAGASDACSQRAILTSADVTVSDGSTFETRSYFHSKEAAAIRLIDDDDRVIAVEGPLGWARVGGESVSGTDFHKLFALGHQYHALLLHFDEIVTDARDTEAVTFRGRERRARSGAYPYGGTVHLVGDPVRPAGLLFEFPETPLIAVTFSDWRQADGVDVPFVAEIDDSERVFIYRYSTVTMDPRSPLWFHEAVSAPDLDEVRVYRLHRRRLAAHCLGDAEMMSDLSAERTVSANRGKLSSTSKDAVRERFEELFEHVDYTEYHDIATPVIEIAGSSDLGWIAVNVRAVGVDRQSGFSFDNQWAWLMAVRKVDGRWLHAGNASNVVR